MSISCHINKNTHLTDDLLAKNYLEGSLKSAKKGNFREAEILLLKAEWYMKNSKSLDNVRSQVQKLAQETSSNSPLDVLETCYFSFTCDELLKKLQYKYCSQNDLTDTEYKVFVTLGGKGLGFPPDCNKNDLEKLLKILKINLPRFNFEYIKIKGTLSKTEQRIINSAFGFFTGKSVESFNDIPGDVLIFLFRT